MKPVMKGTSRAALALAVLGVAVPKYGILLTGVSGIFVIISMAKHSAFARAAVMINFCNLFFLSPLFVMSIFHYDIYKEPVDNGRAIFVLVLSIQLLTLIIHLQKERRRRQRRARAKAQAEAVQALD